MVRILAVLSVLVALAGCSAPNADPAERVALAERYLHAVYECDSAVVDELAADSVVLSYPIIADLYGAPALRGRDAVQSFSRQFCGRWKDQRTVIHQTVADGDNVVLVWSSTARYEGPPIRQAPAPGTEQAWGGITLYRFDRSGKIAAEIGEESTPGPMARVGG